MIAGDAELARAILDTAKVREDSYDKVASNAAADANEKSGFTQIVDYETFYTKTIEQAAIEVNPALAQPVYLLLKYTWNDAYEWAEGVAAE